MSFFCCNAYRLNVKSLQCILAGAVVLACGLLFGRKAIAETVRPPNFILILADDMAPGDFASRNDGKSRTPNLDELRKSSLSFQQAYSASCVCAPARAALLTGRYPHRTGVVTLNMNRYPELTRLKHRETTIAEVFKANGYRTGLIGKWHCGTGDGFGPRDHGFDEFEGFSGSQDLSYFRYLLTINEQSQLVEDQYLTEDLSQRAILFVRRHQHRPFFLHLAHYAPHRPLEAPKDRVDFFRERGLNESTATIYAMIEIMDEGIGRLLKELDRLKLADQTIVIFASDNGPDPLTGTRFNGKLRGQKYEIYEGGIRVPLLIRWPKKISQGTTNTLVHFVDLFPTILELCNVPVPNQLNLDGVSFAPFVLGQAMKQTATSRYWQWNRGRPNYTHSAAVREGDWKLVRPYVTRKSNPMDSHAPLALYNLAKDPSEAHDVAKKFPDRVRQMNDRLESWSRSVEKDRIAK